MKRQRAFTLIEILIAVAILAIALAATTRAASLAIDSSSRRAIACLLATWAAENRIAELRARRVFPSAGTSQLTAEQAGVALVIDETVSDTQNPTIRRVDLAVSDARDPNRVLTKVIAFVGQP